MWSIIGEVLLCKQGHDFLTQGEAFSNSFMSKMKLSFETALEKRKSVSQHQITDIQTEWTFLHFMSLHRWKSKVWDRFVYVSKETEVTKPFLQNQRKTNELKQRLFDIKTLIHVRFLTNTQKNLTQRKQRLIQLWFKIHFIFDGLFLFYKKF